MIDRHTLYVDNFRGFKNTYIPISHVNFLVGENSSGKTSILSLLKLMSDEKLLMEGQFLADDVDLGTFRDIVSANAQDPSYFRIGLIRWDLSGTRPMPLALLITYEKYEGLPRDVSFTCTYGEKELAVRRVGKELHFRVRKDAISPDTDIQHLFSTWIKGHVRPTGGFKKLDTQFGPSQSLLFPLSLIALESDQQKVAGFRILSPSLFPEVAWVAPIRAKPRRTYDELRRGFSSEGIHTPYLIRKLLDTESRAKRFKSIIERIGKGSGLFDSVSIERFGSDVTSPFAVHITLGEKAFNIVNVGYGVSQVLPVIVEVLSRLTGSWFSIQQPEVHLHPRAQAALGEFVCEMAITEDKRFLVETHSDFLIDRYRLMLRQSKVKKPSSQILFFERKSGRNSVTPIQIAKNGELPVVQPRSYRNFFIKEQMELLSL